jgi:hypothetical protein
MRKIPTVFERDWDGDRSRVIDRVNPAAQWVFDGEGVATIKLDGTCCMVRDGKLYARREVRSGKPDPDGFELSEHDKTTDKRVGWVQIDGSPEWRRHAEAFDGKLPDGTYELVGPKVQGNPEGFSEHRLVPHGAEKVDAPSSFNELRSYLDGKDIEGLVWHHPDGRMAKIKLRDFGLKRHPTST